MRTSHTVDRASTSTVILRVAATVTKPGDNMGPYAPTTAADKPAMSKIISFCHCGHLRSSASGSANFHEAIYV
jgi:hypothetical protein